MFTTDKSSFKNILVINGHPNASSFCSGIANQYGSHRQIRHLILEFCGIKPVRITAFGAIRGSDEKQRKTWLAQVAGQARKALA
ncbi:MAG: hypothetical protein WBK51_06155 [Polaromonas sp.]